MFEWSSVRDSQHLSRVRRASFGEAWPCDPECGVGPQSQTVEHLEDGGWVGLPGKMADCRTGVGNVQGGLTQESAQARMGTWQRIQKAA